MADGSAEEKRKDPRYEVDLKVDYASKDIFVSNYVSNISKGGIFIQTESPLPIRSKIQLKIFLPDTKVTIAVKGMVAWNYDIKKGSGKISSGMGIRFVDLSPEGKAVLEEYVQQLSDSPGQEE